MVKRPRPVAPAVIVRSPKLPAVSAAAVDRMPLTATAMVTLLAPAVLSMNKSNTVPAVAPMASPRAVPVGKVMTVDAADVDVM